MRTLSAFALALALALASLLLLFSSQAHAGKIVGEDSAYAREMGFESRFFYVAAGNGAGQIEYICRAFPGVAASSSTASAVWQVQQFTYNASNQLTDIRFAGNDDGFNQICDNRATLDYS